jgi:hypothetical protein
MGVIGAAQSLYGISFKYTDFLIWNFPLLSLLMTVILSLLIIWLFAEPANPKPAPEKRGPLDGRQKAVLAITLCTVALWLTDFVHGLSPAWIGLGAAVLCLYGPCRSMSFSERVKFGNWLIFVAFISLAAILGHTGLGGWLGTTLVDMAGLEPGALVWNLAAVTVIGILVGLVTTNLAGPIVLATLAEPIAQATGWSVEGTLVAMMPSWSVFPLAYQAPVILVAMRMTGVPLKYLNYCLLLLTGFALSVVIPLQFVWLSFLGVLG